MAAIAITISVVDRWIISLEQQFIITFYNYLEHLQTEAFVILLEYKTVYTVKEKSNALN